MSAITKAAAKAALEAQRGDADRARATAKEVVAELGAGADKVLAYRAQRGDTGAGLTLAATLPT